MRKPISLPLRFYFRALSPIVLCIKTLAQLVLLTTRRQTAGDLRTVFYGPPPDAFSVGKKRFFALENYGSI